MNIAEAASSAIGSIQPGRRSAGWSEFRDAADPRDLDDWDGPVQGYVDRIPNSWSIADFRRHAQAGVMRTSVQRGPSWGAMAREKDIEDLAAEVDDLVPFLLFREHLGLRHGGVYVSLNRWPEVRGALEVAGFTNARCRVRIADWSRPPTRFGPAELGEGWTAWAHQFQNVDARGYDRNAYWPSLDPADWDHS